MSFSVDLIRNPSLRFITDYFLKLRSILVHPVLFFRGMGKDESTSQALTFALVTHWIGYSLQFLWRGSFQTSGGKKYYEYLFDSFSDNYPDIEMVSGLTHLEAYQSWCMGVSSVLADPFITLISLLLSAVLIYLALRLMIKTQITFESVVRVVSYSFAPVILLGVPVFGGFVSAIYLFFVNMVGIREYYSTSTGKAVIATLFPNLVYLMFIFVILIFIFIVFVQLLAMAF